MSPGGCGAVSAGGRLVASVCSGLRLWLSAVSERGWAAGESAGLSCSGLAVASLPLLAEGEVSEGRELSERCCCASGGGAESSGDLTVASPLFSGFSAGVGRSGSPLGGSFPSARLVGGAEPRSSGSDAEVCRFGSGRAGFSVGRGESVPFRGASASDGGVAGCAVRSAPDEPGWGVFAAEDLGVPAERSSVFSAVWRWSPRSLS